MATKRNTKDMKGNKMSSTNVFKTGTGHGEKENKSYYAKN
jgi:hypothetical protein